MHLHRDALRRIARGELTLVFRRWRRPTVRAGGSLHTELGELFVEGLTALEARDISELDATRAGFTSRQQLLQSLRGAGTLYRVELAPQRPRARTPNAGDETAALLAKVRALDRRASTGPWTRATLCLIRDHAGCGAAELATSSRQDPAQLERNLRKLSSLGLLEKLSVGHRLSARGRALLAAHPSP